MIDPVTRLRRAIHLNDLPLLKRIVRIHPSVLQSRDLTDDGNTPLHLAAKLGVVEIAEYLITSTNHESHSGISRNQNLDTPLHIAVTHPSPVIPLLAQHFPRSITLENAQGADPIMLLSKTPPSSPYLNSLFAHSPIPIPDLLSHTDVNGNTALHYAAAWGNLKALRTLLEAGADPEVRNWLSWSAVSYCRTVKVEVYFRGLLGGEGGGRRGWE